MNILGRVVIKGAGDLASGVAHRLWTAGFDVVMLELPEPLVVRRTVAFASAVLSGSAEVEGVPAILCQNAAETEKALIRRVIPVLVDPGANLLRNMSFDVLVDAVMAKANTGTAITDAPVVIGLGPGFTAGEDVHAVVETQRGHHLGRAIYEGRAAPNTGIPGEVAGITEERLLRSPADGRFLPLLEIGSLVTAGQAVATVAGEAVVAATGGMLRGLLSPGLTVRKGLKVGDIDPRGAGADFRTISDKARAVGGGVLEAIMHFHHLSGILTKGGLNR